MTNNVEHCEPMWSIRQGESDLPRLVVGSKIRAKGMPHKDERIGFRVSHDIKAALSQIAKKEGRSLAQVCELLLRGGIGEYEKDGSNYLHRLLTRTREK
jgi:hypothetical protein